MLDDPGYSISCNFVDCISNREMGNNRGFQNMRLTSEYATRHMLSNAMMKECPVSQQHMNKVILRYLYLCYPNNKVIHL